MTFYGTVFCAWCGRRIEDAQRRTRRFCNAKHRQAYRRDGGSAVQAGRLAPSDSELARIVKRDPTLRRMFVGRPAKAPQQP
jgi:hypothetical protein